MPLASLAAGRIAFDKAAIVAWASLAQRARDAAALAAQFRNDAATIRFEIEREHYRQHFNGARIDALRGALASIGG